jgi:hypothetical protein
MRVWLCAQGAWDCPALEELHLSDQRLEEGAHLRLEAACLQGLAPSLRVLSIAGCGLDGAALAPLASLRGLRELDISRNAVESVSALKPVLKELAGLVRRRAGEVGVLRRPGGRCWCR